MADHAYRDSNRTQIIYAEDCTIEDKEKLFYCHNTKCSGKVYLKGYQTSVTPHFYSKNHQGWCKSTKLKFDATEYEENLFNLESVFMNLLNKKYNKQSTKSSISAFAKGDGKTRSLSKMAQIYRMCKSLSYNDEYNDIKVWRILMDDRCNHILARGIYGIHMIECAFYRFDSNRLQLFFKYPLNQNLKNRYTVRLDFSNQDEYYSIKKKVFENKGLPIVIFGDWKLWGGKCFTYDYHSGRQIYFPHHLIID